MGEGIGSGLLAALLRPGMLLMGQLRMGWKLLLVAGLSALVVAVVTRQYFAEIDLQIDFSSRERQGIVALVPVPSAITAVQLHRGTSQQALAGDAAAASRLPGLAAQVLSAFTATRDALATSGLADADDQRLAKRLDALQAEWVTLESEASGLARPESFTRHTALVEGLIAYNVDIADVSNLTLDPAVATYYLMDAMVFRLPWVLEHSGRLRGRGAGVITAGSVDAAMRKQLITSDALLGEYAGGLRDGLERAIQTGVVGQAAGLGDVEGALDAAIGSARVAVDESRMLIDAPVGEAPVFFATLTAPIDAANAAFPKLSAELDRLIALRVEVLESRRFNIAMLIGLMVLVTAYLFACAIIGVRRNLRGLGDATAELAGGRFVDAVAVRGRDEFREIGDRLLAMSKAMQESIETERFRARENQRIRSALDAADAAVMILGSTSRKVLYANERMQALFERHASDFAAVAPGFAAGAVQQDPFDALWGGEAALASFIDRLSAPVVEERSFGARRFRISIGPVADAEGRVIGIVFEWVDRTDDLRSAAEIDAVLAAAGRGDFSGRVVEADKHGVFLAQARALNRLLSVTVDGLERFSGTMRNVAAGDLRSRVEADFEGDLAALKDVVNRSVGDLGGIVLAAQQAAEAVDQAAGEINAGNTELSQRTEEQASTLEQAASFAGELSQGVAGNLEGARRASALAQEATGIATRGAGEITGLTTTMAAIREASRRIEAIIGVIDGIAFQTNILALNAAVEAARAGEQGRGFAVVASEVRSLAQRAAGASREVRELIVASAARVVEGDERAKRTGASFRELVASVQGLGTIISDVARASGQQADGIRQVEQLIHGVSTLSQQNAALAEQMNASTEEMVRGVDSLSDAIRHIRA